MFGLGVHRALHFLITVTLMGLQGLGAAL